MLNTTTTLQQAINNIQATAKTIPHTTLNSRKRPKNNTYNKNKFTITAQIALGNHPPGAEKLLQESRNRQKRLQRNNNTNKIQNTNSNYYVNNNINQLYNDDDTPIPEEELLTPAETFGNNTIQHNGHHQQHNQKQ